MSLWIDEPASEHDDASKELVELLASVLWAQGEIEDALEDVPGIDLADVPWPAVTFRARAFWTSFVLDLRAKAALRHLVERMATEFPPKRQDFTRFLQLSAAVQTASARRPASATVGAVAWYTVTDALASRFVGPGLRRPMINRKRLRTELDMLHDQGYRTLNITGDPASGKTFSLQLLQLLAEQDQFAILHVDVADWGTEPFGAVELIDAFARQLKVRIETSSVDSVPDPHTRARLLLFEVRDAFPTGGPPRWIVIDGLDRANVLPDARAFVERLLKSVDVDGKPANVRLVVTGFDGLLPTLTRTDPIGPITRTDVYELFEVSTQQLAHPVQPADLEQWTDEVWNAFDPDVYDLGQLGDSVYDKIQELIDDEDDDG